MDNDFGLGIGVLGFSSGVVGCVFTVFKMGRSFCVGGI